MKATLLRVFPIVLLGATLAGAALVPVPAMAGGWGHGHRGHIGYWGHGYRHHSHSSFVLGLNFLVPPYRPAYYYDPPPYYAPPPRVVYVQPPTACQQFRGNATIDASGRPFYGTACLWPDGRWHIAN